MSDEPDRDGWRRVGQHSYRLEPPDIFFIRPSGDVSEAELAATYDAYDAFTEGVRRAFVLIDGTRMGAVAPQARLHAARRESIERVHARVVFGINFQTRVMLSLVVRTRQLFRRDTPPLVVLPSEAEARAWIDEKRRATQKG